MVRRLRSIWIGDTPLLTAKNVTITLLMLLAVAFSAWSILLAHSPQTTWQNDPTQMDSYMEEVMAVTFGNAGLPSLKITTPKMVHYPKHNSTIISAPRVVIYRQSPEPWRVNADRAQTTDDMAAIVFTGNVSIHHEPDAENPNTSILTQSLTILPEQQIAQTSDPGTFIQPDAVVHAIGMLANLEKGTVQLLSQAQGEYDPRS